MKALIENIQHYCLHDGPGMRTTVFFKGCPLRCLWCSNPPTPRMPKELLQKAEHILFMPDLFAALLGAEPVCERSIASTRVVLPWST